MAAERTPVVAISHDYLTQRGGAERVVLAILRAFPDAELHTLLYDPEGTYPEFRQYRIVTSSLNDVGALRHHHRFAFPLLAPAAARHRIEADVVICSTSGWAHGFPTDGATLVYCHSPARWLYQPRNYLGGPRWASPTGWVLAALSPALTRWDRRAARRAARYLSNSRVVRDRIGEAYGIEATVLPAPHGVEPNGPSRPVPSLEDWAQEGYHLIVSRLLPYKNVGPALAAFTGSSERLVIVGAGPLRERIEGDCGPNARLVSDLDDAQMRWVYAHARALVAPSLEDYGLTPLEAAAFGKPTIALRAGGYLDTIVEGTTGIFFEESTPSAIAAAVAAGAKTPWDEDAIRAHADGFSEAVFAERLHSSVREILSGTGPSEAATRHT